MRTEAWVEHRERVADLIRPQDPRHSALPRDGLDSVDPRVGERVKVVCREYHRTPLSRSVTPDRRPAPLTFVSAVVMAA